MKCEVGGLEFDSDFDSGNLGAVEIDEDAAGTGNSTAFVAETVPDCAGTEHENGNRTWFYFAVRGAGPGQRISVTIRDLNRQGRLFGQGHAPVVRIQPKGAADHSGMWHRGCASIDHDTDDDDVFYITFSYVFPAKTASTTATFFAFCIPFGYDELCSKLGRFDTLFAAPPAAAAAAVAKGVHVPPGLDADGAGPAVDTAADTAATPGSTAPGHGDDGIYYHRELAVRSLDGLRCDIITISGFNGISDKEEPRFGGLFPDLDTPRCKQFPRKKVVMMSARVHPGETPASHVFNGFFDFILRTDDPRAKVLRQLYVFKMVPMLNPDGCKRGHYRTDSRGLNLNRFYDKPSLTHHPTIYFARHLMIHHNELGNLAFYIDQHAHAAKRGCFVYGNALELSRQIDNVTYAKLVAMNSAHFDFKGSCFSEGNMFGKDKRDAGLSKEGSGRVGIFLATNLTHCYTVECNYNTGRSMNSLAPASGDNGMAEKPPMATQPPVYTTDVYEDVGRGFALALLDIVERNPWSRVPNSDFGSLSELKKHVGECIRSSRMKRGNPPSAMPRRVAVALRQQQAIQKLKMPPAERNRTAAVKKDARDNRPKTSPNSARRGAPPASPARPGSGLAKGSKARAARPASSSKDGTKYAAVKSSGYGQPGQPAQTHDRPGSASARQHPRPTPPTSLSPRRVNDAAPTPAATGSDAMVSPHAPDVAVPTPSTMRRQPRAAASQRVAMTLKTSSVAGMSFQPMVPTKGQMLAMQARLRATTVGTRLIVNMDTGCAPTVSDTVSRIPRPGSGRRNQVHYRPSQPAGRRGRSVEVQGAE